MAARFNIIFSARAEHDMRNAAQWYVDQGNAHIGLAWARAMRTQIMTLAEFPLRWPVVGQQAARPVRQMLFRRKHGQYRIFYTIDDKTVIILHIRHAARDKAAYE